MRVLKYSEENTTLDDDESVTLSLETNHKLASLVVLLIDRGSEEDGQPETYDLTTRIDIRGNAFSDVTTRVRENTDKRRHEFVPIPNTMEFDLTKASSGESQYRVAAMLLGGVNYGTTS